MFSSTAAEQVPELLHFATPHLADGRAIRYHFDEFMIELVDRLFNRLSLDAEISALSSALSAELVRSYIAQSLYIELLDVGRSLFRYKYIAELGRVCRGRISCPRDFHILLEPELHGLTDVQLVNTQFWFVMLRAVWRKRDLLRPSYWRSILNASKAWRLQFHGTARPRVAVELVEGAVLGQKSDAYWLVSKMVDPAQVLFVFERHNAAFVDVSKQREYIASLGARAVALHPAMTANGEIPLWLPDSQPDWALSAIHRLSQSRCRINSWAYRTLNRCIERVAYWEMFYRAHNVAISQNFTELTDETFAKRIAMELVGGVEMGKMRSELFERSGAAFHFKHEIAFVWHRNIMPMLEFSRTSPRYLLEAGYVYDYLFTQRAIPASVLKENLHARGVKTIIAAFDNAAHVNGHISALQIEEFYKCLAEIVLAYPDVGVILKPKKNISVRKYKNAQRLLNLLGLGLISKKIYPLEFPNIENILVKLRNTGRCVELSGIKANVIDAGLAADIVVGMPCSTAACEAALAGRSLIMYDPSAARGNPVCAGYRRVSFGTIKKFRDRLEECLSTGVSISVKDETLALLDPLRDGRAAFRTGVFISRFLESFDEHCEKEECLAQAIDAFSTEGGAVLEGGGEIG